MPALSTSYTRTSQTHTLSKIRRERAWPKIGFFWFWKTLMYASLNDFEKAFGADDVVDDTDRMTQCLERATRLVDTYARSAGLTVPLTDVNALADVKGPCLDIARYFVWNDSNNEKIRKHYEDAISFLEKVATRKILLIPTGSAVTTGGFANIRLIRG